MHGKLPPVAPACALQSPIGGQGPRERSLSWSQAVPAGSTRGGGLCPRPPTHRGNLEDWRREGVHCPHNVSVGGLIVPVESQDSGNAVTSTGVSFTALHPVGRGWGAQRFRFRVSHRCSLGAPPPAAHTLLSCIPNPCPLPRTHTRPMTIISSGLKTDTQVGEQFVSLQ